MAATNVVQFFGGGEGGNFDIATSPTEDITVQYFNFCTWHDL